MTPPKPRTWPGESHLRFNKRSYRCPLISRLSVGALDIVGPEQA